MSREHFIMIAVLVAVSAGAAIAFLSLAVRAALAVDWLAVLRGNEAVVAASALCVMAIAGHFMLAATHAKEDR